MNINIIPNKVEKREIYNLKDTLCQFKFKTSTDKSTDFATCFNGSDNLASKCEKWKHMVNIHIKKSFRKI